MRTRIEPFVRQVLDPLQSVPNPAGAVSQAVPKASKRDARLHRAKTGQSGAQGNGRRSQGGVICALWHRQKPSLVRSFKSQQQADSFANANGYIIDWMGLGNTAPDHIMVAYALN